MATDPNDTAAWDARFKRVKNLLDPKDDGDAMTLRYAKNTTNGMITNITNTGDTQVKRVTTTGDTQTKRVTDEGDTQNTRVTSTGDSYVTQMTSLKDIATTKATEASSSADLSRAWAVSKTSPDGTDSMSSMSWAEASKISASSAKTSETNAMSYMLNASSSASNAKASETKANASAVNAKDSEDKAKTSENNSKVSETNAATSEQEAKTHADNAAQYDPRELIDEAYHRIKRDTAYEAGDVLTSTNLPYDVVIDVTQAGTTGVAEPDWDSIKDDIGNSPTGITGIQELKQTKQDKLTFDTTPTEGSLNPVTSGGIKSAMNSVFNNSATIVPVTLTPWPGMTVNQVHVQRAGAFVMVNFVGSVNWDSSYEKLKVAEGLPPPLFDYGYGKADGVSMGSIDGSPYNVMFVVDAEGILYLISREQLAKNHRCFGNFIYLTYA